MNQAVIAALVSARVAAGISQTTIARHFGVAQKTVSNWERGKTDLSHENAEQYAALVGVDLDEVA